MKAFAKKQYFRIGIVGYSAAYYDRKKALELLEQGLKRAKKHNTNKYDIAIVSGLTEVGIPGMAYCYAKDNNIYTVGYACAKAKNYSCFPVNEENIIGEDWGDESQEFLNGIDCLIRIGGGKQSLKETEEAKKMGCPVIEFDLPKKKSLCLMGRLAPEHAKSLRQKVKSFKGQTLSPENEYHITLRYWLVDLNDTAHQRSVIEYLRERFKQPVLHTVLFEGKTDVFGSEEAYVLLVDNPAFKAFQIEVDKMLQRLGASPSDYLEYKPHITIGEKIEKSSTLDPCEFLISQWYLTINDNPEEDSEILWEVDFTPKEKEVIASLHKTAEDRFRDFLEDTDSIEEILDFLVFKCNKFCCEAAAFDHFLLTFFATLPGFNTRKDISESEVEQFKKDFPYEFYGLNRFETMETLRSYRSLNRVIDELVACLDEETVKEIARNHIQRFWFEQQCGCDLQKFRKLLRPRFWTQTLKT